MKAIDVKKLDTMNCINLLWIISSQYFVYTNLENTGESYGLIQNLFSQLSENLDQYFQGQPQNKNKA